MSNNYEITPEEVYATMHGGKTLDPRKLLEKSPIEFEDVKEGDFIGAAGWSRPRRVELVEQRQEGRVLFLAEPDESRIDVNGCRMIDTEGWTRRGVWVSYPTLRTLWDAAHATG